MGANEEMSLAEDFRRDPYRSGNTTCGIAVGRVNGRFVSTMPEADRFWSNVQVGPDCWLWRRLPNKFGYGRFANRAGVMVLAHRFAYELVVGPIPEGLVLDHLCETPACVRPEHLEPVTNSENVRRRHARRRARNGASR